MPNLPHVALLIETSRSYGRGVLLGVRRFIAEHEPWSVYLETRALESQAPAWLENWQGDGILTRTGSKAQARAVLDAGVPAIELRTARFAPSLPFVGVDNRRVGEMVVEHLVERGFRRFGLYAIGSEDFFRQRCENFVETLSRRGFACDVHDAPLHAERPAHWERQQDELTRWVARLEKPAGVMACTDQLAFWLLDACKRAGVAVPEEVAVLGVENDESLCTMATPPLSSVALDTVRTGYVAAELLARMMRGKSRRKTPAETLIEPLGVVARQSSDVLAIEDKAIAGVLRHIREHACQGINVDDVLRAVPISRSKLERDLRKLLGRSPNAEIRRVQLLEVGRLLVETDLTLTAIARRTGFAYVQYLCESFKKQFGRTPGQYRAERG